MGYETEANEIRSHFDTEWADETPVDWPNTAFAKPDRDPWIRFRIRPADAGQADMASSPRFRHDGAVIVQVFVREHTGDGRAKELADKAAAIFRRTTIGSSVFRTPRANDIGPDGRGWYQINVIAPYYRDEVF